MPDYKITFSVIFLFSFEYKLKKEEEKILKFFSDLIKGILIGSGAILPGISSGVFCVIFGIYDKLVENVLGIFKHFKKSISYLAPIAIGGVIGVILFGNILKTLLNLYPTPMKYLFIGLILGSIPVLIQKVNSNRGFRLHYFLFTFLAFSIGILMVFLENYLSSHIIINSIISSYTISLTSILFLITAGFFMSIGIVVPGVSSTVILMCFGIYDIYLSAISTMNLIILIPLGFGVLIGSLIFLKTINYLLNNFYMETFYAIIGFSLGSVLVLYEPLPFNLIGFCSIGILIAGFYIANFFESKE